LFDVDYDHIEDSRSPRSRSALHGGVLRWHDDRPALQARHAFPIGSRWAIQTPHPAYGSLDFAAPVHLEFDLRPRELPCLQLAYDAGRAGGSAPAWLNAAERGRRGPSWAARSAGRRSGSRGGHSRCSEPTELVKVEDVLEATRSPGSAARRSRCVSGRGDDSIGRTSGRLS